MERKSTFPCLVCGRLLVRELDDYEGQPRNAVMCSTRGNYGSEVYDSLDGEHLAFNICDGCLVRAGEQGRVMATRNVIPVLVLDGSARRGSIWGWRRCAEPVPYIPWRRGLPSDDRRLTLGLDEVAEFAGHPEFSWNAGSPTELAEWVSAARQRHAQRPARRSAR